MMHIIIASVAPTSWNCKKARFLCFRGAAYLRTI